MSICFLSFFRSRFSFGDSPALGDTPALGESPPRRVAPTGGDAFAAAAPPAVGETAEALAGGGAAAVGVGGASGTSDKC